MNKHTTKILERVQTMKIHKVAQILKLIKCDLIIDRFWMINIDKLIKCELIINRF